MWNGKNKALTFSFDDGVTQDIRAIKILDRYGLKATFNLNSALLGTLAKLDLNGRIVEHNKVSACDVREIYRNHEVAVHTLYHPDLTKLKENDIEFQVEEDRKLLSRLCGYEVRGMAYPGGWVNNDDRVAAVIRERTGVEFARTVTSTHGFDLQNNLYRFNPTVYYTDYDELNELADKFIALESNKPQLFYIWGHTYEMDQGEKIDWEKFERFCEKIAGKEDIFYGTNSQVFFG